MVASKVEVVSRKVGEKDTYTWISTGTGHFTIDKSTDKIHRGTKINLHLKDEEKDFLDKFHIKHIIQTYSNHIDIKIEFTDEENKKEVVNTGSALWARPKSEIKRDEYNNFYKSVAHLPDEPF